MITMENYEGWLMRYADGQLEADEQRDVVLFLNAHPELREELDEISAIRVTPLVATMPGKERLLRREPVVWLRRVAAVGALIIVAGAATLFFRHPAERPLVAKRAPATTATAMPSSADFPLDSVARHPRQTIVAVRPPVTREADLVENERENSVAETPSVEPLVAEMTEQTTDTPAVAAPLPPVTVIQGYVVRDACLASNPWRDALVLKD